jgi:hypothetical protein
VSPDDDFDPTKIALEYEDMEFLAWVETGIRNGWLDDPMLMVEAPEEGFNW